MTLSLWPSKLTGWSRAQNRDATVWVIAILHIAFEGIAMYCRIAIYAIEHIMSFLAVKAK